MKEIWKDVVGYDGKYWVSNRARVKNINKILKQNISTNGYRHVWLYKNGIRKYKAVHRLIALAFIPNPYNKDCINHIDNNRVNNSIKNLEWVTRLENINYCIKQGRQTKGVLSNKSKLKEKDIVDIRKSKLSIKELSIIYKISTRSILDIINLKSWKHVCH